MDILEQTETQSGKKIEFFGSIGIAKNPKNILFIGVTHGEEPQGKFLIEKFMHEIEEKKLSFANNLFFIPCLNPDGFEKKQRGNSNNVDLNRNFKTNNWIKTNFDDGTTSGEYPFSENESLFLGKVVEKYRFDVILSFHAPFKIVNFDGNAKTIAEKISEIIDPNQDGSMTENLNVLAIIPKWASQAAYYIVGEEEPLWLAPSFNADILDQVHQNNRTQGRVVDYRDNYDGTYHFELKFHIEK